MDAVVGIVLFAMILLVHRVDSGRVTDAPVVAHPTAADTSAAIDASAVTDTSAVTAPDAAAPGRNQETIDDEGPHGDDIDRVAESHPEKPHPPPPAGIIADFLPFTPELPGTSSTEPTYPLDRAIEPPGMPTTMEPETAILDTTLPQRVEFFETETKAASVGFVVDCSSSMDGAKFEAVRAELAKSIAQLKDDQLFFVVFFNDQVFPMSGNSQQPRLVAADHKNRQVILSFLRSATSSGGTNPEPALQFMTGLRPDVLYLLTDGGFNPLRPNTYAQFDAAGVAVHTIGFETGTSIPVLEEIALRTGGTYRSAGMTQGASILFLADPRVVRTAIRSTDPAIRREAVKIAILRQLPFVRDIIEMLGDPDEAVRTTIHDELRKLAEGTDFGPLEANDVPFAVERWTQWWTLRTAKSNTWLTALSSDEPDEVWIAASLVRTGRVDAPDEIIAAMRHAPSPVWQELRESLRSCCPSRAFGPPDGASQEQVAEAADRWAAWRVEERERIARERREAEEQRAQAEYAKRVKAAAGKLHLARCLIERNPAAVVRRCHELIRDFADTPSADEARKLLAELESSVGE
jgi:hypothetical protein